MTGPFDDVHRTSDEIEALRRDLGHMVSELDRRRHELLDVRLQIRRHPRALLAATGAAALLIGGLVALAIRGQRRRRRPVERARQARRALARLMDHPQRVAAEPSMGVKIATAAGVAAGSVLARRVAERFAARAMPAR